MDELVGWLSKEKLVEETVVTETGVLII